jgi:hypothetical protein
MTGGGPFVAISIGLGTKPRCDRRYTLSRLDEISVFSTNSLELGGKAASSR